MNEGTEVKEVLGGMTPLSIVDAHALYKERFQGMSEYAFFKKLSRMQQENHIGRLAKGVYYIPGKGRFGWLVPSEEDIVNHYMGDNHENGIIIGYRLYNFHGLTTQISKTIELYSNKVHNRVKHIGQVILYGTNLFIDPSIKKMVEWLEILEHYAEIEDLNRRALFDFMETAIPVYSDETLELVLEHIKYKKRTLASLKKVLDHYSIPNNIGRYLNKTSRYKTLDMEVAHETAQGF